MRILSVSEMRALESAADMAGHSYAAMMEMAGQGVAIAILRRMPVKGRRVLILVGPGNNGGDGLVVARLLKEAGADVTAYLARERDPKDDLVLQQAQESGVTLLPAGNDRGGEILCRLTAQSHVLIDALLGTGAAPPLRDAIADILHSVMIGLAKAAEDPLIPLNNVPGPLAPRPLIVAVDGPSGMDFDTGAVDPLTLKAHLTVTFAMPKWGHFRFPGAAYVGELIVADIKIPATIDIPGDGPEVATPEMIRQWLPPRPPDAHKGTFGKALIVAGSVNYTGAAALAAGAAVRAGAGLVTLGIPSSLHSAIVPLVPEVTYILLPHTVGVLAPPGVPVLYENMSGYSALLVGPGLGRTPETSAFVRRLLGKTSTKRKTGFAAAKSSSDANEGQALPPLVVDADGLNILSEIPNWPELLPPETILTPHPGEMARLTGGESADIQADRLQAARKHAAAWGHIVVLKGAFTVIAAPNGDTVILPFANPGLSSAGTGDVLAGAIVALRAQGLDAFKAAVAGAYLHGLAGEIARRALGVAGIAAGDVARMLPEAWRRLVKP